MTIPPKGQTAVEIEIERVSFGARVIVTLRSITLAPTLTDKRALLFAWKSISTELERQGMNIVALATALPETLDREIEDDGDGSLA